MATVPDSNDRLMEKLRSLQARYQKDLTAKLVQLDAAWLSVDREACSRDELKNFHLLLHRLAGSAATFGFTAIGEIGQRLEDIVLPVLNDGRALDGAARRIIRDGLDAIRDAAGTPEPIVLDRPAARDDGK